MAWNLVEEERWKNLKSVSVSRKLLRNLSQQPIAKKNTLQSVETENSTYEGPAGVSYRSLNFCLILKKKASIFENGGQPFLLPTSVCIVMTSVVHPWEGSKGQKRQTPGGRGNGGEAHLGLQGLTGGPLCSHLDTRCPIQRGWAPPSQDLQSRGSKGGPGTGSVAFNTFSCSVSLLLLKRRIKFRCARWNQMKIWSNQVRGPLKQGLVYPPYLQLRAWIF